MRCTMALSSCWHQHWVMTLPHWLQGAGPRNWAALVPYPDWLSMMVPEPTAGCAILLPPHSSLTIWVGGEKLESVMQVEIQCLKSWDLVGKLPRQALTCLCPSARACCYPWHGHPSCCLPHHTEMSAPAAAELGPAGAAHWPRGPLLFKVVGNADSVPVCPRTLQDVPAGGSVA